ncbi:CxC2 domain-containing protein [Mycena sanguinolenta]|uniref:CxC2 domain-containing protein n=1 Tax=Mycena sanguinolenta TaxID=230812 RepID=A0A8H6YSL5_9AGAR|nr:CxC2 domain-containing protein [Mycena sanguinolenta]
MSKWRKVFIEEEDLNDGSGSDDEADDYVPRNSVPRIHQIPTAATTITSTGRTRNRRSFVPTPASPAKKTGVALKPHIAPLEPNFAKPDWEGDFAEFDAEYGPGIDAGPRALRESDDPHGQWAREYREQFLDEILRLDGRGDYIGRVDCSEGGDLCGTPEYRCTDCLVPCMYCEACIVAIHKRNPLHHVERWSEGTFQRCSLKSLGVRIQLGHAPGVACPNPEKAWGDDFVIIGSHTIDEHRGREVGAAATNATVSSHWDKPSLRGYHLLPAAFFAHLTLESKCSAYEFYNSLARETNNTGLQPSRERYDEFVRMTRQWMHLMLLKRGGRGHNPGDDRINSTRAGELALLCPACPHPGKNLPQGWENAPPEQRFLYALFLAIDANFRLKRKDVSSEARDPSLSRGWAFYGEVTAYMAHLDKYWDTPQERSTCVAHDAVDKPDRESKGTASSGIGTVDCARHNMKRPNGVGDLQKGEKYLNMDYMVFMSMAGSLLLWLFLSYDIACQWYKNLWTRMEVFPEEVKWKQDKEKKKKIVFLVPKFHLPAHIEQCNIDFSFNLTPFFHLPAHIEQCNIDFSFNLTPFVGRTDGEAPERGWADANRLANSTSISGPGARRDTLDAHFQYSNWKKIVKLGTVLLEKIQKNVPLMLDARAAWIDVEASFAPAVIEAWTAMAVAWERDNTNPNPFASTVKHNDLRDVRLRMAEIARADITHERVRGDMHETEMLSMALQLEQQQRALATHMKSIGAHETVDQERTRIERETKLRRKIDAWMAVQELFMPEVAVLRERENAARVRAAATQPLPGIRAQDMQLWLPSAIGGKATCDASLLQYEFELRHGQAIQALDDMRGGLLLRTHEWRYRDGVQGVKAKMRSGTRVAAIQARIDSAAAEYRAAHAALTKLGPLVGQMEWKNYLKPLEAKHVRGRPKASFADEERRRGGGRKKARVEVEVEEDPARVVEMEGQKEGMSWIWLSEGRTGTEGDVVHSEPLRIEWAKKRAHAMRYREEVDLLEEEMRRVLQFLEWRADWWTGLLGLRAGKQADAALREGHSAYAQKQAGYMRGMRERFAHLWRDVPRFLEMARAEYATMEADEGEGRYDTDDTDS